ncbi:MAG: L-threonylcarbamoyladenylate synthase [Acidimicrobiales bacterium]
MSPRSDPGSVDQVAASLAAGLVVAIPTDTVYGLAVDPNRPGATRALAALKRRPAERELAVLVAGIEQADALAGPGGLPPLARRLADRFWPGALTLVVGRRPGLDWELGGPGDTVGVRCPAHPDVRSLCVRVGPLAVTSANLHGAAALRTAAEVIDAFGAELTVLDGGRCDGMPSTVDDMTGEQLRCLRVGAVPWADVVAAAGAL